MFSSQKIIVIKRKTCGKKSQGFKHRIKNKKELNWSTLIKTTKYTEITLKTVKNSI